MPFCANCGAPVDGRFCAKCGAAVGGAAEGPPPPVAGPEIPASFGSGASELPENVAGALCYVLLLVTGILFLVLAPYNKNRNVRFHAFQAILLNIAWFVIWFVVTVVLGRVGFFLAPLVSLAFLALWLYLIISTYQGKTVALPGIGPLARQQA